MKKTYLLTAVVTLICHGLFACSCIGKRSIKEEIRHSDLILTGKIISKNLITLIDSTAIKIDGNLNANHKGFPNELIVAKYELAVTSRYKGKLKSNIIEIFTGNGDSDCGINFEIGQEYVIYGLKETYFGQKNNDLPFPHGENIIWTNICSRTTMKNKKEISGIEKYRKRKRTGYNNVYKT